MREWTAAIRPQNVHQRLSEVRCGQVDDFMHRDRCPVGCRAILPGPEQPAAGTEHLPGATRAPKSIFTGQLACGVHGPVRAFPHEKGKGCRGRQGRDRYTPSQ